MLTNCLPACAHLTITVSEIQRDICEKIFILSYTPCIQRPHYGGSRRNIGTPFGTEKLEWCRYPMVEKFRRYLYSYWRDPRTWQTDGQTLHDSKDRACIASRGNYPSQVHQLTSERQHWQLLLLLTDIRLRYPMNWAWTSAMMLSIDDVTQYSLHNNVHHDTSTTHVNSEYGTLNK